MIAVVLNSYSICLPFKKRKTAKSLSRSRNSAKSLKMVIWRTPWIGPDIWPDISYIWPDYPPPPTSKWLRTQKWPSGVSPASGRKFGRKFHKLGRIIRPPAKMAKDLKCTDWRIPGTQPDIWPEYCIWWGGLSAPPPPDYPAPTMGGLSG